jgi:Spy/CpxP family protein refolding chaperone
MTADKFDEGKVKKIITQQSDVKKEIQIKRALHQREVRNLLTPEQQKKFDLHLLSKGERGKKGGRGFHRGRCGGPGPIQDN